MKKKEMKIRDLLTDETKWCQRALARNKEGEFVFPDHNSSCSWCLLGAIDKCYNEDGQEHVKKMVREEIYKNNNESIHIWNDSPDRTFKDIRNLVEKLEI